MFTVYFHFVVSTYFESSYSRWMVRRNTVSIFRRLLFGADKRLRKQKQAECQINQYALRTPISGSRGGVTNRPKWPDARLLKPTQPLRVCRTRKCWRRAILVGVLLIRSAEKVDQRDGFSSHTTLLLSAPATTKSRSPSRSMSAVHMS